MIEKNILIVEDEWIIYDEMASFLSKKGFAVAPYTKSYDEAINQIRFCLPDMVLLDIHLQGDKDGIDLGEKLNSTYKIPFIYLSANIDEVTVNRARRTNPDTFLIKTKPEIDKAQLVMSISMALVKNEPSGISEMEGLLVYSDYYRDVKQIGSEELKKVLFRFDDVLWIETDSKKRNYLLLQTSDSIGYFKSSLTRIKELIPFHFVRINTHQIVNLKKVEGKVNHSSFKIQNRSFRIGGNFSEEVHKVLHRFYHE